MNDALKSFRREKFFHLGPCRHVKFNETKARIFRQNVEPGIFQRGIVLIVDVIKSDNVVATLQQKFGDLHADEAGGACDKNLQFSILFSNADRPIQ